MGKWHSQVVEVFNKSDAPYREKFNEQDIVIPGREAIKMKRADAENFIGTMSKPLANGGWEEKALEIREIEKESDQLGAAEHVCNFCGFNAETKEKLKLHLKDHKDVLLDQDPERDEEEKNGKAVICSICDKEFETVKGLQIHLAVHAKEEKAQKTGA